MKNRRLFLWIFLVLASTSSLCGRAVASQAVLEYNISDKELNVTYKKGLAIITEPRERQLFVEAQRSWVKFRDANVAFHARYFSGSKGGLFLATDMTQERIKELKKLLTESAKQAHEEPFAEDRPR